MVNTGLKKRKSSAKLDRSSLEVDTPTKVRPWYTFPLPSRASTSAFSPYISISGG